MDVQYLYLMNCITTLCFYPSVAEKSEQTRRLNCHGKVSEYRPDAFVLVNKSGVKMTAPRSLGDES